MISEQWQLGLLIGVVALHLLTVGLAYRRRDRYLRNPESTSAPKRDLIDREERVVECPACATENELGYRYCQACVGELPTSMSFGDARTNPLGRIAR